MYCHFYFCSAWFLLTQVWQECTGMSKANEHLKKQTKFLVFLKRSYELLFFQRFVTNKRFWGSWNKFKRSITLHSALTSKIFLELPVWCYSMSILSRKSSDWAKFERSHLKCGITNWIWKSNKKWKSVSVNGSTSVKVFLSWSLITRNLSLN